MEMDTFEIFLEKRKPSKDSSMRRLSYDMSVPVIIASSDSSDKKGAGSTAEARRLRPWSTVTSVNHPNTRLRICYNQCQGKIIASAGKMQRYSR